MQTEATHQNRLEHWQKKRGCLSDSPSHPIGSRRGLDKSSPYKLGALLTCPYATVPSSRTVEEKSPGGKLDWQRSYDRLDFGRS